MTRLFGHSLPSRITKWNNIEQLAGGNMVEIYDLGPAITIWPFLRLLSLFLKTLRVIGSLFLSLFPGYAQVGTRLIWPLKPGEWRREKREGFRFGGDTRDFQFAAHFD